MVSRLSRKLWALYWSFNKATCRSVDHSKGRNEVLVKVDRGWWVAILWIRYFFYKSTLLGVNSNSTILYFFYIKVFYFNHFLNVFETIFQGSCVHLKDLYFLLLVSCFQDFEYISNVRNIYIRICKCTCRNKTGSLKVVTFTFYWQAFGAVYN